MFLTNTLLNKIATKGQSFVAQAESLHLSSVAKSIEQEKGRQIFIEPFEDNCPNTERTSCLATCEPCIIREVGKPPRKEFKCMDILHHFIFYKEYTKDREVERFRIAHELGHCILHWPLGPREDRLITGSYHGVSDMYLIEFEKQEEMEADAFACLLTAHRPMPERGNMLVVNDYLLEKIEKYERLGLLQSMFMP